MSENEIFDDMPIPGKSPFKMNWLCSKDVIYNYTREALGHIITDKDDSLRENGYESAELVYRLGHNGRGMDDFPSILMINVDQPQQFDMWDWTTKTTVSEFYLQILDPISLYVSEYSKSRKIPNLLQPEIEAMTQIIQHLHNVSLDLRFGFLGFDYHLFEMRSPEFGFKSEFE